MPDFNGTGPSGQGPFTGRAMGYCTGYNIPGLKNPVRAFGRIGRGRGYCNMYWATGLPYWLRRSSYPSARTAAEYYQPDISPEEEIKQLKQYSEVLKKQLDEIQGRIDKLSAGPEEK